MASIKLEENLESRVQHIADARNTTASAVLVEAVSQYLAREEARDGFETEAAASWAAYVQTGRHLDGQETSAWLKTWGTDEETEPPDCHV